MKEEELNYERKKLSKTIETMKRMLESEKDELKDLKENFKGEYEELWRREDEKNFRIKKIESSLNNPYFARIDFKFDGKGNEETFYIGKHGINTKDANVLITDWRAPISSLYYDADKGKCSFEGPFEIVNGEMFLKRQFEIEEQKLIEYFDVELVSNDQLLQKYLNANNDSRLKSIVSTIQKEQNDVIRRKLNENLIVQGVAGSGKTTVALHRIAYLVYNYLKFVKQDEYLVIGPNPVFIKYIKSVLPDLDVSSVTQCTFEELAMKYIEEKIIVNTSDKKVVLNIEGLLNNDIDKFKSSIKFMKMLNEFIIDFIKELTKDNIAIGDFIVLRSDTITSIFNDNKNKYSLDVVIERTIEAIYKYIISNMNQILSRYNTYSFEIFEKAKTDKEKNELRDRILKETLDIKKGCRNIIRKYFSKSKISVLKLYKDFINVIENYNVFNYENIKELKTNTIKNIRKGNYDFEDLASLMYIKKCISPNKRFKEIRHTVVDEAQDLGEFNFYVIKNCLPSSTFSIFGDISQSIYDYRGIDNWDIVNRIMFNSDGKLINFNKSYRTTAEIMNVADDVAEYIGQNRSELVIRHGNRVHFNCFDNDEFIVDFIIKRIKEYKEYGYKTIVIISKTDLLSKKINDLLAKKGLNIPNVTINDDLLDSKFNICTISNQLAKGLEFDAVIINNANEELYSSSSILDMKLLYVAITRALHELDIVYTKNISKPLEKWIM